MFCIQAQRRPPPRGPTRCCAHLCPRTATSPPTTVGISRDAVTYKPKPSIIVGPLFFFFTHRSVPTAFTDSALNASRHVSSNTRKRARGRTKKRTLIIDAPPGYYTTHLQYAPRRYYGINTQYGGSVVLLSPVRLSMFRSMPWIWLRGLRRLPTHIMDTVDCGCFVVIFGVMII
jgi:hypothetical protein